MFKKTENHRFHRLYLLIHCVKNGVFVFKLEENGIETHNIGRILTDVTNSICMCMVNKLIKKIEL